MRVRVPKPGCDAKPAFEPNWDADDSMVGTRGGLVNDEDGRVLEETWEGFKAPRVVDCCSLGSGFDSSKGLVVSTFESLE